MAEALRDTGRRCVSKPLHPPGGVASGPRVRRLTPERLPPSYLVLRLNIQVAYRNNGARPLIIPVEHERTVYTALKPGVMNIFRELTGTGIDGLASSLKV